LFGGGIIPEKDATALLAQGIGRLFGPGTPMQDIIGYLQQSVRKKTDEPVL